MLKRFCLVTALVFSLSPVFAQTVYQAGMSGLGFGGTISASGNEIIVGSAPMGWPRGAEPAGTVFIYTKSDEGLWVETASLQASDGGVGDDFGRTVFLNGNTLVVGSPGWNAAYVFTKDADGNWSETGKLEPGELQEGDEFGGAYARAGGRTGNIAMAGRDIAVTSFNSEKNTGRVHVFSASDGAWAETAVLRAADAADADGFARSVAGDGHTIFVSAPLTNERKGKVYIFMNHGQWTEMGTLEVESEGPAGVGAGISVSGNRVYVGAPTLERAGAVLVYETPSMGVFELVDTLKLNEPAEGDPPVFGFGADVKADGENIIVTSRRAAYAFRVGKDGYQSFSAPDERARPGFGTGLALSGDVVAVGSPTADYEAGIPTVFERRDGEWTAVGTLASDVAQIDSYTGEKIECEDGKAREFACDAVDLVSFMNIGAVSDARGVGMTDIWGWEDPETGKEWVILGRTEGVSFVDISNPSNPMWVGEMLKTESSPGSGWRDVKVYKDHAFVVADGAQEHGMQIFDLTQLRDVNPGDMPVTFPETVHYTGTNSTHNIVINEETGFTYAVGNSSGGETCGGQLHMINIQDPANPEFAGCFFFDGAGGTHDSQCVIYHGDDPDYRGSEICLNSNGSMFVIADVSNKEDPVTLATTSYPNQAYTHQGWLSEDHNYFYMNDELDEVGGTTEKTRTLIWDVRDLEDPTLVKEFLLDNTASDHNLYIRGNLMFQSNYQAGLRILDVTDPENPVEVGHFDTVPFGEDEAGFGGAWSSYPYFKSGIIAISSRGEGLFLVRKREVDI